MTQHLDTGRLGEDLAQEELLAQGYEIIARNWRYKNLEIDFIAKDQETLVFVEVKTRRTTRYGQPHESVDWKKQQKLARAANIYLQYSKYQGDIRFDIVSIILNMPKTELSIIKDAFWPS